MLTIKLQNVNNSVYVIISIALFLNLGGIRNCPLFSGTNRQIKEQSPVAIDLCESLRTHRLPYLDSTWCFAPGTV